MADDPTELVPEQRGDIVEALWMAVNDASGGLANVPGLVRRVLETGAWRDREQRGKSFHHDTFESFITSPPLAGCGWPLDKVKALIRDDPTASAMFRDAITGAQHVHQPDGSNRTVTPTRGTTRDYTLSRLSRERPDLMERVVAGEISANAAAIEAGWRHAPAPANEVRRWWRKLSDEEREAFLHEIMEHVDA